MTKQPAAIAAGLAASACLLLAGASGASAQIANCWMANSAGPPIVRDAHIFCGEINAAGNAVGFHSRPGGINPLHTPAGGAPPVAIIGGGVVGPPGPGAPAGIYRLTGFTITQGGVTQLKAFSTMFPDACTAPNVLAAIRNAAAGAVPGGAFNGLSGPTCQAGAPPAPFNITGFTNAAGTILTAYPNY